MEGTSFADFKIYNPANPDFLRPRGHMFTYVSITSAADYNFGGSNTSTYPTSGVNLAQGSGVAPSHGVYLVPHTNQVMYVTGVKLFFNHTAKSLFTEDYKDRISTDASNFQLMHNGSPFCVSQNAFHLTLTSDDVPLELPDAITTNEYFYSMSLPLKCPGRFDGDEGNSFGVRTSGGNGIYLGTSFAANKLTYFAIQFTGWIVNKIDIGGAMYEVIPR